jgi:hypothetical protein
MDTQTPVTPLQLLERVWQARFSPLPWDKCFTVDHSLPYEVVEQVAGELGLTLEEVNAALECWRRKMFETVDAVVADCMAATKKLCR